MNAPPSDELDLYRRVRDLLGRVTYKEGWRLVVVPPKTFWERTKLKVEFEATDSRGSGRTVAVSTEVTAPASDAHDEVLVEWVWCVLTGAEVHEAGEWFRVDGVAVRDPHPSSQAPSQVWEDEIALSTTDWIGPTGSDRGKRTP